MAEEIGVSFQQLQKYESGRNRVSGPRIWLVADALGLTVSTFFPPVHVDEVPLPEIDDPD
jgi:transcriptional regulator with XRE-family HTH domain